MHPQRNLQKVELGRHSTSDSCQDLQWVSIYAGGKMLQFVSCFLIHFLCLYPIEQESHHTFIFIPWRCPYLLKQEPKLFLSWWKWKMSVYKHHIILISAVLKRQNNHVPMPWVWQSYVPHHACGGVLDLQKSNKEDTQLCNIIREYHIKGLNAWMCKLNSGSKETDVPLNCNTRASASPLLEQLLYRKCCQHYNWICFITWDFKTMSG